MSRKIDYFVKSEVAPSADDTVLVCVPSRYIPQVISAIEGRKPRSFWASDDDYQRGYQALTRFQEALLMDATEQIIVEIRGVRGPVPPATAFDLATYPVGSFPGFTLGTLNQALRTDTATVAQLASTSSATLEAIRVLLETQATTQGDELGALLQIAALLGV
jgi:hypothetical protein